MRRFHIGTNPLARSQEIKRDAMTVFSYEEAVETANAINALYAGRGMRREAQKAIETHQRVYERLVNLALSLEMVEKGDKQ